MWRINSKGSASIELPFVIIICVMVILILVKLSYMGQHSHRLMNLTQLQIDERMEQLGRPVCVAGEVNNTIPRAFTLTGKKGVYSNIITQKQLMVSTPDICRGIQ